jgi:hypothetical protein
MSNLIIQSNDNSDFPHWYYSIIFFSFLVSFFYHVLLFTDLFYPIDYITIFNINSSDLTDGLI